MTNVDEELTLCADTNRPLKDLATIFTPYNNILDKFSEPDPEGFKIVAFD